jgi:acetylornithine deacetylase
MKGFIAVALACVPSWKRLTLARPVHLMFSYDEEVGCLGAPSMIAAAQTLLPKPAAVIVGEPTSMRVANEHKGLCALRTRVTGVEAHSSLTHRGMSAVMLAGELIAHLGELSREVARAAVTCHPRFEPPHTTLSVNLIEGGTAINILAGACEFGWDIRTLPGDAPSVIREKLSFFVTARLAELLMEGKRCTVETTVQAEVPPLLADAGPAIQLGCGGARSTAGPISVPFVTEGGHFQRAGWSTIVCGPGDIAEAHMPDEFIERSALASCESFLDAAILRQCR